MNGMQHHYYDGASEHGPANVKFVNLFEIVEASVGRLSKSKLRELFQELAGQSGSARDSCRMVSDKAKGIR